MELTRPVVIAQVCFSTQNENNSGHFCFHEVFISLGFLMPNTRKYGHYEMFDFVPDHNPGPGADIWKYGHWPVLVQCLDIGTSSDLCSTVPGKVLSNLTYISL